MIEVWVIVLACFVSLGIGAFGSLVFCLKWIFDANRVSSQYLTAQKEQELYKIEAMNKDFSKICAEASKANLSLGEGMRDFEKKLADLSTKVNMLHMRAGGK